MAVLFRKRWLTYLLPWCLIVALFMPLRALVSARRTEALVSAVRTGDYRGAKALIAKGANVNTTSPEGDSLLRIAAQNGRLDVVALLEGAGAKRDGKTAALIITLLDKALAAAVGASDHKAVQLWIKRGASVTRRRPEGALLMVAVRNNDRKMVTLLQAAGATSDATTDLFIASLFGRLSAVKTALARGADVNARDSDGDLALVYAITNGDVDILKTIIQHGANVNSKRSDGMTPLMWAAQWCQPAAIKLLLDNGAHANAKDQWGATALNYAMDPDGRTTQGGDLTRTIQVLQEAGCKKTIF